jgi:putative Mg2+ transporter-C (MgtC) family protein
LSSLFQDLPAFWSLPVIQANLFISFHLIGALILGLIVGYERTYRGRAAGMRTYGLVCMASTALTVIVGHSPLWYGGLAGNLGAVDPTRVIQGIVTGIGFLGAGIIMKDGFSISGLTTAASVWESSAIGVLIGVGFYGAAIFLTLLSVVFMMWGLKIESWLPSRPAVALTMRFKRNFAPDEDSIQSALTMHGYQIARGSISIAQFNDQVEWRFVAFLRSKEHEISLVDLSETLSGLESLENFQISHARN